MTPPRAMLLAAGRGERMGALTRKSPKPLLRIGDHTLIERQIWALRLAGVREFVINVSYRAESLRAELGNGQRFGASIVYSDEGEPALETAGGIINALPLLGDAPFIVANADVVTDFDYSQLVAVINRPGPIAAAKPLNSAEIDGWGTLVLVPNPPHHPDGDFGLSSDGWLDLSEPRFTYAGIAMFHPCLFHGQPVGHLKLRPLLDAAIQEKQLAGLFFDGLWVDVGTPERLDAARNALTQE